MNRLKVNDIFLKLWLLLFVNQRLDRYFYNEHIVSREIASNTVYKYLR